MHVLTLFNWYAASYALMMLSLLELAIVAWIYGNTFTCYCRNCKLNHAQGYNIKLSCSTQLAMNFQLFTRSKMLQNKNSLLSNPFDVVFSM